MALSLKSLRSAKSDKPPIVIAYGVDGVGKTSLAAEFPNPVCIQTDGERPPQDVEIQTFGVAQSYDEILDAIGDLLTQPHAHKTLIIDSLDGVEPLVWRKTIDRIGVKSIEDAGYGKGYVEADTEWCELLAALGCLREAGIAVVLLAHPEIVRFDSPVSDPYSRYNIKLHKRANAIVRERADIVTFINYRASLKIADVGFNKKVTHAEGSGDRQMHFEERPGFVAKNRYSMPPAVLYKKGDGYTKIASFFPQPTGVAAA